MKIYFIILLLSLTSCYTVHKWFAPAPSNEFIPFVNDFERRWGHKITTPIYFINQSKLNKNDKGVVGACIEFLGIIKEIQIVKEEWDKLPYDTREIVIFHELSHCELRIWNHIDDRKKSGCPVSIMTTYLMNPWELIYCYEPNREYYLNEIFNGVVQWL